MVDVRPGKLDSLFPIHQILCLYVGGRLFFIIHYTVICLQTFKYSIIKKACKKRIMKVEAVVLKPMRAGDGKQGIKFAWPNVGLHLNGFQPYKEILMYQVSKQADRFHC